MALTYFKRYRMEIDLDGDLFASPPLPAHYHLLPWHPGLLESHARAKYHSFCTEIDANVFPCLGDQEGCRRLMTEISRRRAFVPEATWLMRYQRPEERRGDDCGTIQGIVDDRGYGAIQNVGITPIHRGQGLGTVLLLHALLGFRRRGLSRCFLEVTAENSGAIRLYERLGFRRVRTVYKASHVVLS